MTKNIAAKIDLILHATEDFQKIVEPLDDLFGIGNVILDYALTAIDQTNSSLYSNVFSLRIDIANTEKE